MHSTETALLKVSSDMMSAYSGECTILVLVDLSSAFDAVDHKIINRLKDLIYLSRTVLEWFSSFLSGRHFYWQTRLCLKL